MQDLEGRLNGTLSKDVTEPLNAGTFSLLLAYVPIVIRSRGALLRRLMPHDGLRAHTRIRSARRVQER